MISCGSEENPVVLLFFADLYMCWIEKERAYSQTSYCF